MKTPLEISNQYAEDILSGRIPSCVYIKKACERYKSFFDKYEFREDKLNRVVDFIGHFKHFQGKSKGKPFILEPWQVFIVANIFAWYHPNTDKRVTQSVFLEMSRKQGKTALIAAIGLYCLVADGEAGAEIDCIANSVKQAHLLFDMAKSFSGNIDPKKKHFQRLRDTLKFPKTTSLMQVQASDSANLDGYNPSVYCLDECHEYPDSKLYDVMVSGTGMRTNPLGLLITTAGFSITGFCYTHRKMCIDILYGLSEDDTQFSMLYELDEKDEWDDPNNWIKSNPNLGITVTEDFLRKEVNRCKNNASLKKSFLTKNLNRWVIDGLDTWISDQYIVRSSHNIEWDFFKDRITYIGIDLSSVSDFSCATWMTKDVENDLYYFKTKFYLPEASLHDNPNAELYQQWYRQGFLTVTEGNVVDYDWILKDILESQATGIIIDSVHYDQYNATLFAINATSAGLKMSPFPQSLSNFNKPTKELERLILQNKVIIDNNPMTRWCFSNAVLKHDWNNNCLALDTKVPTPSGIKTIADLNVGDYVFDEHGNPVKIIDTTDIHYGRDCYELTFRNHSKVVCDETHRWLVNRASSKYLGNNKKHIFEVMDLKDTKWIYEHPQKISHRYTITTQPVQYPEKKLPIDPYILGLWLGDGSSYRAQFTCEEKDISMYDCLKDNYSVTIKKDSKGPHTYNISVAGGLYTQLREQNLLKNKHIPQEYLTASVEQRFQLLRGLMDTDGTCSKISGQCSFVQAINHKNLIDEISILLDSLGIHHSITDRKTYFTIQFYTDLKVFNLERKYKNQLLYNSNTKNSRKNNNQLLSIRKVDSVPTRCITVDSDTHLFLITEHYTVTSNCKPVKRGGAESMNKIDAAVTHVEVLGGYLNSPNAKYERADLTV